MTTDRSDKLHFEWRASTEKFDYFILGLISALCAFVAQGYKPTKLAVNPASLELVALLILVLGAVAGFRRIEQTLLVTSINQQILRANEGRGAMVKVAQSGSTALNESTGQIFNPVQAIYRAQALTETIDSTQPFLEKAKLAALRAYRLRNALTLVGFLSILAARVWSAYV